MWVHGEYLEIDLQKTSQEARNKYVSSRQEIENTFDS